MGLERQEHWSRVYEEKAPGEISWYQAEPEPSLRALNRFVTEKSSSFIDIGGGASNLVDALLDRGWTDITVLDIAASALEKSKARLGPRAVHIRWAVADIITWRPDRQFNVWHDRAVFHFLTAPEHRNAYRQALIHATARGTVLIFATFAPDGPERCSGLPVQRYDPEGLAKELGRPFDVIDSWHETHVTPWGSDQSFSWSVLRRAE
jgi:hypothetical protein